MHRAVLSRVARRGAAQGLMQARCQSAPAWAKPEYIKVFESDFATAEYPEFAVGGDHLQFSKLMFQLAAMEKKEDKYLADLKALLAGQSQLGTFWRTESNIGSDKAFSSMEPGLKFVLRWMQTSSAMDKLENVVKIFAIYVKAAKKTIVVPVTLAGLPETQPKQVEAAKKAAEAVLASHHADKKGWKLEYEFFADPGLIDGWRLEVAGTVVEDMAVYLETREKAASAAHSIDYTSGPASKSIPTAWPHTPATALLSDWCDELSLYDAEEARFGC